MTRATAAAVILTVVGSGVALADNINDSIEATAPVTLVAGSGPGTATITVVAPNNSNDGDDRCNVDAGDRPLVIDLVTPTGVTADPDPVELGDCGAAHTVTFTAAANAVSGTVTATITQQPQGGGTYNNNVSIPITIIQPADTTKPTLNLPANITTPATGPSGATVSFSATAEDANPASPAVACSPASGATFPVGTTTVNCSAKDAAQNEATGSFTVTVTPYVAPDTTAPTLHLPANTTQQATSPSGAVITYTATADDANPASPTVTCTPASGAAFPVGPTTVSCSAKDAANNEATGSFTVTITPYDVTPPVVTVPEDVISEATSGAGASVTYAAATAVDDRDGPLPASCLPASGSPFPIGTTTVTCSATDTAGNTGTASFTVTVGDTAGPVLTLPQPVTAEATGPAGAAVTYTASADDAVDGTVAIGCAPASGATFPLGLTTVSCSATDLTGHPTTGGFTVTVVDTTKPVLTVPPTATIEAKGSDGTAFDFTATATDIVDPDVEVVCSRAGGTFPIGTTEVSCTATDDADNTTTSSFSITVSDTTGPTLTLPEGVVAEATGPDGAVVTFDAMAFDAVAGDVTVSCTPASGSTFSAGDTTVECTATDGANTTAGGFTVTVRDTTPPDLNLPAAAGAEATGPTGATVAFTATATDLVDGDVDVTCDPASGSTFPLGPSTVTCTATDAAGNPATGTIPVIVTDMTGPAVTVPSDDLIVEATGPDGATVDYADLVSAEDAVDGAVTPSCAPASGSVFPLGPTTVGCSATDARGNSNVEGGVFTVRVVDTVKPVITVPANVVAEATGPTGAGVTFAATATDAVDTDLAISCTPPAGTFAIGTTPVTCTATDDAGNAESGSFTVTVQDTTAPVVTAQTPATAEATSAAGAVVMFTATATDAVTGSPAVTCTPSSGSTFVIGTTKVTCTATDGAGNTGTAGLDVVVEDTTEPTGVGFGIGPANGGRYYPTTVPTIPTCAATDVVGIASCVIGGYSTAVGSHTLTATATDNAGNMTTVTGATYTVRKLLVTGGFFQPVDNNGVVNVVKNGSTVPLKFTVSEDGTPVSDTALVTGFRQVGINCNTSAVVDDIEITTTGGTSLRYDATARQFVQNWQTPRKPGTCYTVTLTLDGGATLSALFKLK